jgi:hypothetical protein
MTDAIKKKLDFQLTYIRSIAEILQAGGTQPAGEVYAGLMAAADG